MTGPQWRIAVESGLVGAVVGALVVAPWTTGGYLLLLDWAGGPHQALGPSLQGLGGRSLDALPFRLATQFLREVLGPHATVWLLVWLYFPIAAAGASVLVGGGRWRRHSSALAMVCNPFVADRVRVGHVAFLLSVAALVWLLHSALSAGERWFAVRPAAWFALAVSCSPHAAWLGGVLLVAVALRRRPRPCDIVRTCSVGLCAAGVHAYGIVVWAAQLPTFRVSEADLTAYATRPGPGGLVATVVSLHGLWRDGGPLVRDRCPTPLAVLVLLVALTAVAVGLGSLWREQPSLGRPLVVACVVGVGLGMGVDGPLGWLYRLLFEHVPLFAVMREQHKWTALAMIGFAAAFGACVDALSRWARPLARTAAAVCACAPLVAAPALLWGLGGTIATSEYPASWRAADELMGSGDGRVLFLPWHAYQPFDFTGGRTVATPAAACFRRPVITADSVEVQGLRTDSTSSRSAYLDRLVADAGGSDFGRLVAPLGVEYVALSKGREDAAYRWLEDEPSLVRVLDAPELALYRVTAAGTGRVGAARVAGHRAAAEGAAGFGTEAVLPAGSGSGPVPSRLSGGLLRLDATTWWVAPGQPGPVVLPEEWSTGWRLDGAPGTPATSGAVVFTAGPGPATVVYQPAAWWSASAGVSVVVLVVLVVTGLVHHRPGHRPQPMAR